MSDTHRAHDRYSVKITISPNPAYIVVDNETDSIVHASKTRDAALAVAARLNEQAVREEN